MYYRLATAVLRHEMEWQYNLLKKKEGRGKETLASAGCLQNNVQSSRPVSDTHSN